jgi:hypothetical protein
VDHIIDLEQERLPFPDNSVSHVFSSHCLEHLKYPLHKRFTGAYWNWHALTYIVSLNTAIEIHRTSVPLDFALKYYKNVALEFGVRMTVHKTEWSRVDPVRYVSMERDGVRYELPSAPPIGQPEIEAFLQTLSSMSSAAT